MIVQARQKKPLIVIVGFLAAVFIFTLGVIDRKNNSITEVSIRLSSEKQKCRIVDANQEEKELYVILRVDSVDQESIEYTLINQGTDHLYYGEPFDLKHFDEGEWISVTYNTFGNLYFTAELIDLPPKGSIQKSIRIEHTPREGEYLFEKRIESSDENRYILSVEFEIIEDP